MTITDYLTIFIWLLPFGLVYWAMVKFANLSRPEHEKINHPWIFIILPVWLINGVLKSGRVSWALKINYLLMVIIFSAWQAFLHLALIGITNLGYGQSFVQYLELMPFPAILYQVESQSISKVVFVSAIWYFVWNGLCQGFAARLFFKNDFTAGLTAGLLEVFASVDANKIEFKRENDYTYRLYTKNVALDIEKLNKARKMLENASNLPIPYIGEDDRKKGQYVFLVIDLPVDEKGYSIVKHDWLNYKELPAPDGEKKFNIEIIQKIPIAHNSVSTHYWDLEKLPHILMVGKQGGGKTNAVYVAAENFLRMRPYTMIVIVDLLKAGTNYYKVKWDARLIDDVYKIEDRWQRAQSIPTLPNVIIIETLEEFIRFFFAMKKEKEQRARLFKQNWVGNFFEGFHEYGYHTFPMFGILIVIEEVLSLVKTGDKNLVKTLEILLGNFAQIGRDRPFNYIFTSQDGTMDVMGHIRRTVKVMSFGNKASENRYLLDAEVPSPLFNGICGTNAPNQDRSATFVGLPLSSQRRLSIRAADNWYYIQKYAQEYSVIKSIQNQICAFQRLVSQEMQTNTLQLANVGIRQIVQANANSQNGVSVYA